MNANHLAMIQPATLFSPDAWQRIGAIGMGCLVVLAGLVAARFERMIKRLDKRKLDQPIEITVRMAIDINIQLDRALHRFSAMRVHLNRFVPSDRFAGGGQMVQCVRSHERVRPGVDRQQEITRVGYQPEIMNELQATTVPHEIELALKIGPAWTRVCDLPDCKFRWLAEASGTLSVARCAVVVDREVIGFLGADFDTVVDGEIKAPENINELCDYAREIGKIIASQPK